MSWLSESKSTKIAREVQAKLLKDPSVYIEKTLQEDTYSVVVVGNSRSMGTTISTSELIEGRLDDIVKDMVEIVSTPTQG